MLDQVQFGKRLREFRKRAALTQKEAAMKIGVSEQAVSKWEKGDCLPDVYNLKLLARILGVSADCLLDADIETAERVVDTLRIGEAVFELVEKPGTLLAGKLLYARDYPDMAAFDLAVEEHLRDGVQSFCKTLAEPVLPINDIHLSVNFWRSPETHAFGFVREVLTKDQPEGTDLYELPASLYVRAHTGPAAAVLLSKAECEPWELFSYLRDYFLPEHGYQMAENGAQELEVFDSSEHRSGYAYLPVMPR